MRDQSRQCCTVLTMFTQSAMQRHPLSLNPLLPLPNAFFLGNACVIAYANFTAASTRNEATPTQHPLSGSLSHTTYTVPPFFARTRLDLCCFYFWGAFTLLPSHTYSLSVWQFPPHTHTHTVPGSPYCTRCASSSSCSSGRIFIVNVNVARGICIATFVWQQQQQHSKCRATFFP